MSVAKPDKEDKALASMFIGTLTTLEAVCAPSLPGSIGRVTA